MRDNLLMMLDEAVQVIYEETGFDYDELPPDVKEIVDHLQCAADAVRRNL